MSDGSLQTSQSTGSVADIVGRMRSVLPASWFPVPTVAPQSSTTPILDGVLSGISQAWSFCYLLLSFVQLQTRLKSLTGSFLDLYALDFFGLDVRRISGETDDIFMQRIHASLLPEKATRNALLDMLFTLTGSYQSVFEPSRAADTGGYGITLIGYGSDVLPYQTLLSVGNGSATTKRETVASYIDQTGQMQIANRHVLRSQVVTDGVINALIEARGFNLIKDSLGWSGFTLAPYNGFVSWNIANIDAIALLKSASVLEISINKSGFLIGPSVSGPSSGPLTASAWIRVPSGHQIGTLRLAVSDSATSWYASVDLTILDTWQRVVTTVEQSNGQITAGLVGTSNGITQKPLYTQCWQIELGNVATSYIPSSFQIGFRDADVTSNVGLSNSSITTPTVIGIRNAVNRVMPAGSIGWLQA